MKFHILSTSMLLFSVLNLSAVAQTDVLTPSQQKQLLERLSDLEKVASQVRNTVYSSALTDLKAAVGQPRRCADLYVDCVNEVDFRSQGKKMSEFSDWKKRNLKLVREDDHERALQLQVRYLIMTMNLFRIEEWEEVQGLIGSVLDYLDAVAEAESVRGVNRQPVLKSNLNQSYFVRRYKLEKSLNPKFGWVMNAGDFKGIYNKFIFPNIIGNGDRDLLDQVWSRRLKQEKVIADKAERLSEFMEFDVPALEWNKAKNIYDMGNRREAFLMMLGIIKNQTNHPEALNWIAEFKTLVSSAGSIAEEDDDGFF